MPTVSVIIPSYNHEAFITTTIESVLKQTFQDFEIVVVDDGSKDKTVAKVKAIKDKRLRLFTFVKNRGACEAANYAVSKARGKYIAMLSSDDVFEPEKLALQVKYLNEYTTVGAVFSYAKIIDENGKPLKENHFYSKIFEQSNRTSEEWLRYFFFNANCLCHPSALIRKKVYIQIGNYDPRFAQLPDLQFWVRLTQKFEISILPKKLIQFRIHSSNISGDTTQTHTRHLIEYKWILEEYLKLPASKLLKIFPESKEVPFSQVHRPFFLAKLSLELLNPAHLLFGLDILFNLLKHKPQLLERRYHFTHADFTRLTASKRIFDIADADQAAFRNSIAGVNYSYYELGVFKSSLIYKLWRLYIKMLGRLI